jgi:hypothetical protein
VRLLLSPRVLILFTLVVGCDHSTRKSPDGVAVGGAAAVDSSKSASDSAMSAIERAGAKAVVDSLFQFEMDDSYFRYISTGDSSWFRVAAALLPAADGGVSIGLRESLADALGAILPSCCGISVKSIPYGPVIPRPWFHTTRFQMPTGWPRSPPCCRSLIRSSSIGATGAFARFKTLQALLDPPSNRWRRATFALQSRNAWRPHSSLGYRASKHTAKRKSK